MPSPSQRRPPARTGPSPEKTPSLLPILVSRKVLTTDQAERVHRLSKMNGITEVEAATQLGLASEARITEALASHVGLPYVAINPLDLDLDVVTRALPGPFARRHGLVAISKTATQITIAVYDPHAPFPEEDIKRVTGLDVVKVLASRSDVERVSQSFYDLQTSLKTAEKQLTAGRLSSVDISNQEFLSATAEELDPAAAPVVKALDHILNYAFEQRASDIHFEPKRELTLVRLRIDGVLHDVHLIPRIVYQAVVSRIKLLSGCDLAEKRRPQDGRIKRDNAGRETELRVSTMPTAFGEKAVLRIFDPDILLKGIDEMGLSSHDLPKFYDFISRSHGIMLVTGPTGSGKTTTLYSTLKHLSKPEVNIITIEDPIEMVYEDFNQVAVRPQIDVTFASALRTVLRQDPDIIMVGEIRDTETAEHAVQAALTGHLVLSTLHTNDAPSSITRLIDLEIPPFLISSTIVGVLAQRLVRVNCKSCSESYAPTQEEAEALRIPLEKLAGHRFRRGPGCLSCRQTGFSGRDGIFEVMPISDSLQHLVNHRASSGDLFKQARKEGMRTLREAGIEKVVLGTTTVEEAIRVVGQ
jgi:general secretion pathway protein E